MDKASGTYPVAIVEIFTEQEVEVPAREGRHGAHDRVTSKRVTAEGVLVQVQR
jgi:hypothetical protein